MRGGHAWTLPVPEETGWTAIQFGGTMHRRNLSVPRLGGERSLCQQICAQEDESDRGKLLGPFPESLADAAA